MLKFGHSIVISVSIFILGCLNARCNATQRKVLINTIANATTDATTRTTKDAGTCMIRRWRRNELTKSCPLLVPPYYTNLVSYSNDRRISPLRNPREEPIPPKHRRPLRPRIHPPITLQFLQYLPALPLTDLARRIVDIQTITPCAILREDDLRGVG